MKINTTGRINKRLKKKVHFIKEPFGLPFELTEKDKFIAPPKYENKRQMDAFKSWRKVHPNFMTPYLVKTYRGNGFFVEVSEGEDFEHKPMYGVSVVSVTPDRKDSLGYKFSTSAIKENVNKPIQNKNEAMAYAESLSKKSKKELLK